MYLHLQIMNNIHNRAVYNNFVDTYYRVIGCHFAIDVSGFDKASFQWLVKLTGALFPISILPIGFLMLQTPL